MSRKQWFTLLIFSKALFESERCAAKQPRCCIVCFPSFRYTLASVRKIHNWLSRHLEYCEARSPNQFSWPEAWLGPSLTSPSLESSSRRKQIREISGLLIHNVRELPVDPLDSRKLNFLSLCHSASSSMTRINNAMTQQSTHIPKVMVRNQKRACGVFFKPSFRRNRWSLVDILSE